MANTTHVITADTAEVLSDIDYTNTAPATGFSLVYTAAGAWEPTAAGANTLAAHTDTNIAGLAAGHILVWDNTAGVWDNVALATGDGIAATAGDGTLSIAADVNGLTAETTVAPAADFVMMYDTSAGAHRKVLVSNIVSSVDTLTELTDTNIAGLAAGHILVWDATASLWDNVALATGEGIAATAGDGTLSVAADVNGLTAETTVAPAADFLMMYDTSAGAHRKVLVSNIVSSVDTVAELTDTNIAGLAAGHILVWDNTASVWDNVALAVSGAGAEDGLVATGGDGTLTIGLDLTGLPTTAIDAAADFIPFYDVSGTANGKVLISDLRDDDWRVAAGTAGSDPAYADNKRTNGNIGVGFDPTTDLDAGAGTVNAQIGAAGDIAAGMGATGGAGIILESANGTRWRITIDNTGHLLADDLV